MVTNLKIAHERVKGVEVRPTLIIGLGGTGTVIARWAYHYITHVFGQVPPFIRFLALDTDVQEQSKVETLPIASFVNLFERLDLRPILRDYREHPEDFPFLSWLGDMPLDSSLISSGCQGLSRLGRVVYFLTRESVIEPEVTRNLRELTASELPERLRAFDDSGQFVLAQTGRPLVHICASICGGTGSGLLLDLAYDVRHWGRAVSQSEPDVIGHLLLPEAFSVGEDLIREKLRSVACAMLEQIEWLANQHRDDVHIEYRNGEKRTISPVEAPFDLCYLVNGNSRAGSSDRAALTAMMGRMVAAFAYEPIGREILADANNKQQDILTREEPPRRRRFFATYGLACGAAQSQDRNHQHVAAVRLWVARALADLAAENRKAIKEEQAQARQTLQRVIAQVRQKRVPEPQIRGGHTTLPSQIAQQVRKELQGHLETLENQVRSNVAAELEKRLKDLQEQLLEQAVNDLERDVRSPVTPLRAYSEVLNDALREIHDDDRTAEIRERAIRELKQEYANFDQARRDAEKVWHAYADRLAQAAIDQVIRRHLGQFRRWIEDRIRVLERAASSALRQATSAPGQDALPIPNAIRLVDLGYPLQLDSNHRLANTAGGGQGEADQSPLKEIERRFVKDLVAPTVRELLNLGEVTDQAVDEVVRGALSHRKGAFDQFWRTCCEESLRLIYISSNTQAPTGHPLTPKLLELKRQSQPRLAINQKGRYKEPLEVAFSQQTPDSCFPNLLRPLIGHHLRETFVAQEYAQKTNVPLVLAQFAYGISVPAIDNYESYRAAVDRYISNTDMGPNHLWLNDEWYSGFQCLTAQEPAEGKVPAPDAVPEYVDRLSKIIASLAEETAQSAQSVGDSTVQAQLQPRAAAMAALVQAITTLNDHESQEELESVVRLLEQAEAHVHGLGGDRDQHEVLATLQEVREGLSQLLRGHARYAGGA